MRRSLPYFAAAAVGLWIPGILAQWSPLPRLLDVCVVISVLTGFFTVWSQKLDARLILLDSLQMGDRRVQYRLFDEVQRLRDRLLWKRITTYGCAVLGGLAGGVARGVESTRVGDTFLIVSVLAATVTAGVAAVGALLIFIEASTIDKAIAELQAYSLRSAASAKAGAEMRAALTTGTPSKRTSASLK